MPTVERTRSTASGCGSAEGGEGDVAPDPPPPDDRGAGPNPPTRYAAPTLPFRNGAVTSTSGCPSPLTSPGPATASPVNPLGPAACMTKPSEEGSTLLS